MSDFVLVRGVLNNKELLHNYLIDKKGLKLGSFSLSNETSGISLVSLTRRRGSIVTTQFKMFARCLLYYMATQQRN